MPRFPVVVGFESKYLNQFEAFKTQFDNLMAQATAYDTAQKREREGAANNGPAPAAGGQAGEGAPSNKRPKFQVLEMAQETLEAMDIDLANDDGEADTGDTAALEEKQYNEKARQELIEAQKACDEVQARTMQAIEACRKSSSSYKQAKENRRNNDPYGEWTTWKWR